MKESVKTGRSIRELVLERGLLADDELDRALDVLALTKGGVRRSPVARVRPARGALEGRRGRPGPGIVGRRPDITWASS